MVRDMKSNQPFREDLIPLLMRFGEKFSPIEHPERVNPLTDTTLDHIILAIAARLPEEKDIDFTLPENNYAEWPKEYTGYNSCLREIKERLGIK